MCGGDMNVKPKIDEEKCGGCGLCVSVCNCGALKIIEQKVVAVNVENCGWCTLCELVCPNDAISCPFDVIIEEKNY
jgi:NAD-dependent dihydropyrimidine dehydrogenase PreA subunit